LKLKPLKVKGFGHGLTINFFRSSPGVTENLTTGAKLSSLYKLADKPRGLKDLHYSAFTKTIMEVLTGLHSGKVKPEDLNADLWNHTASNLLNATGEGFNIDWQKFTYDSPDFKRPV
jgi:hypothetical protein